MQAFCGLVLEPPPKFGIAIAAKNGTAPAIETRVTNVVFSFKADYDAGLSLAAEEINAFRIRAANSFCSFGFRD